MKIQSAKAARFGVGIGLMLLVGTQMAEAKLETSGKPSVRFLATGPAGLKIEGKGEKLTVEEKEGKLQIVAPLAEIDTGISLRNKHMHDKYLETPKFPDAVLTILKSELKFPSGPVVNGKAKGELTLHGVTKSVEVEYSANGSAPAYKVTGTTKINITDFGIEVPKYLGVTVKPDVEISVEFEAADKT